MEQQQQQQQQQGPPQPVSDPNQFTEVLQKLMSPHNQERELAEKYYKDTLECSTGQCLGWMMTVLGTTADPSTIPLRQLVAVLLRKELVAKKNLSKLDEATVAQIKAALLTCLKAEDQMTVKKKIADSIATYAVQEYMAGAEWSELLTFLWEAVNQGDNKLKECAFHIFVELSDVIFRVQKLQQYFQPLLNVFSTALGAENQGPDYARVRSAALKATITFLTSVDKPKTRKQFQSILPLLLNALRNNLNEDPNSNESRNAVDHLIDLVLEDAQFFRPHIADYVSAMIQIGGSAALEYGIRSLAMEFLLCLAETAPAMCRKIPNFIVNSVSLTMQMMLEIEENEDFNSVQDDDDEDDESVYEVGKDAIDRLGIALTGKHVVPAAFAQLSGYLSNENWKARHAALMVMSQLGEVLDKTKLAEVVNTVLTFFQDGHPRVRYAAINCIGQLCTDFNPKLQTEHYQTVLPALIGAMDDTANPRVQSHAAAAIINFAEECPKEILEPFLSGLLGKLVHMVMTNNVIVQEQAITAMASIADSAGEEFAKYYDQIVPLLMQILAAPATREMRTLRGRAMECVTQVGVVVGKEKFGPDALKIVNLFQQIQSQPMEDDDPQKGYILQAWARICRCLEKDFLPYLPTVMPPLLEAVKHMPQVDIVDAEDYRPEEGVDSIPLGSDKKLCIRTSGLDDKLTACKMLRCYVVTLKEGFLPHLNEITEAVIPLLKFVYMEDIRMVAAETIPTLIEAAKAGVGAGSLDVAALGQVFVYLYTSLMKGIKDEPDIEVLDSFLEAMTECFQHVQGQKLVNTPEMMKDSLAVMIQQIKDCVERMEQTGARREDEDYDEEEEENINEDIEREGSILINIQSWFGELIKMQGELLWPLLHEQLSGEEGGFEPTTFMNEVTLLLDPKRPIEQRRVGMYLLDDILEKGGPGACQLYQTYIPVLMAECRTDNDDGLRQAAGYGLGVCAEVGAEAFAPYVPKTLQSLYVIVNDPRAREAGEDDEPSSRATATDNAVSAIGKIVQYQNAYPVAGVDPSVILPLWLKYLPVVDDEEEAIIVHKQLATFVETSLLPIHESVVPHIVKVFANIFGGKLSDDALNPRIATICKSLQSHHNELFMKAGAALTQEEQQNLQKLLA